MTSESILERESNQLSNKEQNSIIAFKIIDGIKDILAEDHEQKQPLILSLNEKLIINLVKEFIHNKNNQCMIGITGESASGKTTLVNYVTKH